MRGVSLLERRPRYWSTQGLKATEALWKGTFIEKNQSQWNIEGMRLLSCTESIPERFWGILDNFQLPPFLNSLYCFPPIFAFYIALPYLHIFSFNPSIFVEVSFSLLLFSFPISHSQIQNPEKKTWCVPGRRENTRMDRMMGSHKTLSVRREEIGRILDGGSRELMQW